MQQHQRKCIVQTLASRTLKRPVIDAGPAPDSCHTFEAVCASPEFQDPATRQTRHCLAGSMSKRPTRPVTRSGICHRPATSPKKGSPPMLSRRRAFVFRTGRIVPSTACDTSRQKHARAGRRSPAGHLETSGAGQRLAQGAPCRPDQPRNTLALNLLSRNRFAATRLTPTMPLSTQLSEDP